MTEEQERDALLVMVNRLLEQFTEYTETGYRDPGGLIGDARRLVHELDQPPSHI